MRDHLLPAARDPLDALREAIHALPVPGAPPSLSRESAAIGLAFLDAALRQNHVLRLTERLRLVEHRLARRSTEVDISLGLLDAAQRDAAEVFRTIRNRTAETAGTTDLLWVPVARVAQEWEAPIDVVNADGSRLPRLTQFETARLLAAGLYQLLKGILSSLPDSAGSSDLARLLYSQDDARWLLQEALATLLTEHHTPVGTGPSRSRGGPDPVRHPSRQLLLGVLDRYAPRLDSYRELLGVALHEHLLVVGLDGRQDEHLLSYDSPPLVGRGRGFAPAELVRWARRSGAEYRVDYRTSVPANLWAYHLVAETRGSVEVARMHLVNSVDEPRVRQLGEDLRALADRLGGPPGDDALTGRREVLDWALSAVLRELAEVVRRRRWEAEEAGLSLAGESFPACVALARVGADPEAQPGVPVTAETLRAAAVELVDLELGSGLSLASDPESNRAHAYWRRSGEVAAGSRQVTVHSTVVLRDSISSQADSIIGYLLALIAVTYLVSVLLTGSLWPSVGSGRSWSGTDADAIVAVLLLVPGFIYTRLDLPPPRSIAARVHLLARSIADLAIGIMIVTAAVVATGPPADLLRSVLTMALVAQLVAVLLLLRQRYQGLGRVRAPASTPRWARPGGGSPRRDRPDAEFSVAWAVPDAWADRPGGPDAQADRPGRPDA